MNQLLILFIGIFIIASILALPTILADRKTKQTPQQ